MDINFESEIFVVWVFCIHFMYICKVLHDTEYITNDGVVF